MYQLGEKNNISLNIIIRNCQYNIIENNILPNIKKKKLYKVQPAHVSFLENLLNAHEVYLDCSYILIE